MPSTPGYVPTQDGNTSLSCPLPMVGWYISPFRNSESHGSGFFFDLNSLLGVRGDDGHRTPFLRIASDVLLLVLSIVVIIHHKYPMSKSRLIYAPLHSAWWLSLVPFTRSTYCPHPCSTTRTLDVVWPHHSCGTHLKVTTRIPVSSSFRWANYPICKMAATQVTPLFLSWHPLKLKTNLDITIFLTSVTHRKAFFLSQAARTRQGKLPPANFFSFCSPKPWQQQQQTFANTKKSPPQFSINMAEFRIPSPRPNNTQRLKKI